MPEYKVLKDPLVHNEVEYEPGSVVEIEDVHAEPLLAAGLLEPLPDPDSPEVLKERIAALEAENAGLKKKLAKKHIPRH